MRHHRRQSRHNNRGRRHNSYKSRHPSRDIPQVKRNLDINCNLGQGFGVYQNHFETKVLPYVTSVNISCGLHAGDPLTMAKAIDSLKNTDIKIGALIGLDDKVHCGEIETYVNVDELRALVLYQLGALHGLLHARGLEINHVRAHGFLYKLIYTDVLMAETVAKAIHEFSSWITLVGLSGHVLTTACNNANIRAGHEVQIARRYRKDGTILPSTAAYEQKMVEHASVRARELIQYGNLVCEDGSKIKLNVDTIHVPSDTEQSIELARAVRSMVAKPRPLNFSKHDKYLAAMSVLN